MENWIDHKPVRFEYNGKWIKNWFSNMVVDPIYIEARLWPSVENYYQAMKSTDRDVQEIIRAASPSGAKSLGKKVILRKDWEQIKESKMKHALSIKFSNMPWFDLLMATNDTQLIEWNNWGDKYWGVTENGVGKNRLGVLLMELRDEFKQLSNGTIQVDEREAGEC